MNKILILLIFFGITKAKIPQSDSLISKSIQNKTKQDCDACGCAINNNSIGFDGLLNKQYIGIKYFSQHYKVKENIFVNEPNENQYFNSIQLLGKIPINKKLILYGVIPCNINTKESNPRESIEGLGDITLLANYYLINNQHNTKNSPHKLLTNIGLKIPTGKFDKENAAGVNPSFQVGTGSWDVLTSVNYQFIKPSFAIQLGTDYIIKGENEKRYKFGNQFNTAFTGYYFFSLDKLRINPKIGLIYENYQSNHQLGDEIPKTSGSITFGKTGIEINYNWFTLGSDISVPFYENLAEGEIEAVSRFSLFLTMNF